MCKNALTYQRSSDTQGFLENCFHRGRKLRFSLIAAAAAAPIAGLCMAGAASAEEITLRDANGGPVTLDTSTLRGCAMVFDQSGDPFEICRMEAINVAPENTARRRPGATEETSSAEIVYRRVEE